VYLFHWLRGPMATRLTAAAAMLFAVTGIGIQITHVYGGLEPHWLHAGVTAAVAAIALLLLTAFQSRRAVWIGCPIAGALIWAGSCAINLAVCDALDARLDLVIIGFFFGGLTGAVASLVPDALVAARWNTAGDAQRHARFVLGAWSLAAGTILHLACATPSFLPSVVMALGLLLLTIGMIADLRDDWFIRQVRAGRSPGWRIADADGPDLGLPPLFSGEQHANLVLIQQQPAGTDPFRSADVLRRVGRLSFNPPAAIKMRVRLTIVVAAVVALLLAVPPITSSFFL
jgi:hypothetical protein